MSRLLIRSGKDPFTPVSAETTLVQDVFNSNSGNLLFQHSLWRALSVDGAELVSNGTLSERRPPEPGDVDLINAEFDRFVIPLANAFRPEFIGRLDLLSDLIEQLTIPVNVVGVGAQAKHGVGAESLADIDDSVRRFVGLVLDRSASIGVRGTFTHEYLTRLGFPADSVDIIGCPSLFLHGRDFRVEKRVDAVGADSKLALNLTPEVPGIGAFATAHAERHPNLTYVAQDQNDIRLMLWGQPFGHVHDPSVPVHIDHPLYQQDRIRLFLDTWTWYDHLAEHDFTYGTRFHGNVAGLLAGTPAMLLAHDSRTLELAEHHKMPHRVMPELTADVTVEELYEATDLTEFNAAMPANFDRYVEFLDRNDLEHVWRPGAGTGDFDERLAAAELPPPVRTLAAGLPEVASRLLWLRNGMVLDITRHPDRYRYPFEHPLWSGAGSRHARLKRSADARMDRQRDEIKALKEGNKVLRDELKVLRSEIKRVEQMTPRRILGRWLRKLRLRR